MKKNYHSKKPREKPTERRRKRITMRCIVFSPENLPQRMVQLDSSRLWLLARWTFLARAGGVAGCPVVVARAGHALRRRGRWVAIAREAASFAARVIAILHGATGTRGMGSVSAIVPATMVRARMSDAANSSDVVGLYNTEKNLYIR